MSPKYLIDFLSNLGSKYNSRHSDRSYIKNKNQELKAAANISSGSGYISIRVNRYIGTSLSRRSHIPITLRLILQYKESNGIELSERI